MNIHSVTLRSFPLVLLLLSVIAFLCMPAQAATVTFDFDSGSPVLQAGNGLPLNQTAGGITATFTGRFSVQNHDTTFYNLPNFSGNYLVPTDVFSPSLSVSFDHLLNSISFDFATADFGLDTNTSLKLTAFQGSMLNPPVGSSVSQAVGDGFGLGTLSFSSASPFNLVDIVILPGAGSDFLADNFSVTSLNENPVPEPTSAGSIATGIIALAVFARVRKRS